MHWTKGFPVKKKKLYLVLRTSLLPLPRPSTSLHLGMNALLVLRIFEWPQKPNIWEELLFSKDSGSGEAFVFKALWNLLLWRSRHWPKASSDPGLYMVPVKPSTPDPQENRGVLLQDSQLHLLQSSPGLGAQLSAFSRKPRILTAANSFLCRFVVPSGAFHLSLFVLTNNVQAGYYLIPILQTRKLSEGSKLVSSLPRNVSQRPML